jgi:hypothetical protein
MITNTRHSVPSRRPDVQWGSPKGSRQDGTCRARGRDLVYRRVAGMWGSGKAPLPSIMFREIRASVSMEIRLQTVLYKPLHMSLKRRMGFTIPPLIHHLQRSLLAALFPWVQRPL